MELQFTKIVTLKIEENDLLALKAFFTGWTDRKITNELIRKVDTGNPEFRTLDVEEGALFLREFIVPENTKP